MSASDEVKVLFAGDVLGNFSALYKRVDTVSQKVGRFDCLVCVGDFFGEKGLENIQPYLDGKISINIPTFFALGLPHGRKVLENVGKDGVVCPNLTYLHPSGMRDIQGLKVAFLSGRYDPLIYSDTSAMAAASAAEGGEYRKSDVQGLVATVAQDLPAGSVLDLLITTDWGKGVLRGVHQPPPQVDVEAGSPAVSELVKQLQPRYHVSAGAGVFFTRDPYKNPRGHVTRFIGLASVGNSSKQKWLHALGLPPSSGMPAPLLFSVPPGSTPAPYSLPPPNQAPTRKRPVEEEDSGPAQPWRFQESKAGRREPVKQGPPLVGSSDLRVFVRNLNYRTSERELAEFFEQCGTVAGARLMIGDDGRPRGMAHVQFEDEATFRQALLLSGETLSGREVSVVPADPPSAPRNNNNGPAPPNLSGQAVEKCCFCLSNPEANPDLVSSIGDHFYVSLEKAPVVPHHVQLIPIAHMPNTITLPEPASQELARYLDGLRRCFDEKLDKDMLVFERYMALRQRGGNHCFVAAVPVSRDQSRLAGQTFKNQANQSGFEMEEIPSCPSWEARRHLVQQRVGNAEYLMVVLPDGSALLQLIAKGQSLNFAREVTANIVGKPERGDWKACILSKDEEQASFDKFKSIFSKYDIMQ